MKVADTTIAIRTMGKMEKFYILIYNHLLRGRTVFVTGITQEFANFTVKRTERSGVPSEYHSTFNEHNVAGYKFQQKQIES
jgi:hypothetical protein